MKLEFNQIFTNRQEIANKFGGDIQKGITLSSSENEILLFTNNLELYTDYFYPKGSYDYCMYTGIGREGHQDSINNKTYKLNIEVLAHSVNKKHLLVFEKRNTAYYFIGEYQLLETHQNVQPDKNNEMRRVFVFHLKRIAETYSC